jgi:hypothetical protein
MKSRKAAADACGLPADVRSDNVRRPEKALRENVYARSEVVPRRILRVQSSSFGGFLHRHLEMCEQYSSVAVIL